MEDMIPEAMTGAPMPAADTRHPFLINPAMRLVSARFTLCWHCIDSTVLQAQGTGTFSTHPGVNVFVRSGTVHCICIMRPGGLDMLYSDQSEWYLRGEQTWLRATLRGAITATAERVLPVRLHELEAIHGLRCKKVEIKPLRRHVMGQCSNRGEIALSPMIIIFPSRLTDEVILHEMAHLQHFNHGKKFWQLLSRLLGEDAEKRRDATAAFYASYYPFFDYLLKK